MKPILSYKNMNHKRV